MPPRMATEVLPRAEDREPTQVPVFVIFVRMGLVAPFSDFLLEILRAYDLKLLHLTPGAILDLSVFPHAEIEVVPEQRHGGHHPDERLTSVGKDG